MSTSKLFLAGIVRPFLCYAQAAVTQLRVLLHLHQPHELIRLHLLTTERFVLLAQLHDPQNTVANSADHRFRVLVMRYSP